MKTQAWIIIAAAALISASGAPKALAQADGPGESSDTRSDTRADSRAEVKPAAAGANKQRRAPAILRRPLIDLEEQAKSRRPGQIMPGDPAPGSGASGAIVDLPATDRIEPAPTPVAIKREPAKPEAPKPEVPKREPSKPDAPKPEALKREAPKASPAEPAPTKPVAIATPASSSDPAQAEPLPELPAEGATPAETPARPVVPVATDIPARRLEAKPAEAKPAETKPTESKPAETPVLEAKPAERDMPERATERAAEPTPAARSSTDSERVATEPAASVAVVSAPASAGASPTASTPTSDLPPVTVLGPAKVRVLRAPGNDSVEWRSAAADWAPATTSASAEGRVEVRAGLDGDTVLIVEDRLELRVGRLARAAIETAVEVDGTKTVHITLGRGMIEVRPIEAAASGWSSWVARVRTPDRAVALVGPSSIEYDAFAGARIKMLSTDASPR